MHPSTLPADIVERMRVRRGRLHLFEKLGFIELERGTVFRKEIAL